MSETADTGPPVTEPPATTERNLRIGLFGGSFNPPHVAHVLATAYALGTGAVDEVWIVPVFQHAFPKDLELFEHRVEMVRLAAANLRATRVCLVERDLEPPNYTLNTVQHLQKLHRNATFRLIVGSDALVERKKWHGFDELVRSAPLLLLKRLGHAIPEEDLLSLPELCAAPSVLPNISSSEVRAWLARNDDEATHLLRCFVPDRVLRYIDEHRLYRTAPP